MTEDNGYVGDPSAPLLKELLTKGQWEEIRSAGGLDDSCMSKVYEAIAMYRQQRTASSDGARRLVNQSRDAISKAKELILKLCEDQEFLRVGANLYKDIEINWPVFSDWVDKSEELLEELGKTHERFDLASQSLMFPEYGAMEQFVYNVLSIRANFQKKAPPIFHKDSSNDGRFVEYVWLCARAADSELETSDPNKFNKRVDAALKKATESLNFVRVFDPDSWAASWESNPQSSK